MRSRKEIEARISEIDSLHPRTEKDISYYTGQLEALAWALEGSDLPFDCGQHCGTRHTKQSAADSCRESYRKFFAYRERKQLAEVNRVLKCSDAFNLVLGGQTLDDVSALLGISTSVVAAHVSKTARILYRYAHKNKLEHPKELGVRQLREHKVEWFDLRENYLSKMGA